MNTTKNHCTNCHLSLEACNRRRREIGGKHGYCCPACREENTHGWVKQKEIKQKEEKLTSKFPGPVIRPENPNVARRPIQVGQVWVVESESGAQINARWFVISPFRVIALFAGAQDHTPTSLIHTYGDRLRLESVATVYADEAKNIIR